MASPHQRWRMPSRSPPSSLRAQRVRSGRKKCPTSMLPHCMSSCRRKIEQRAPEIAVAAKGDAPKVINIMAALKESVQAKGRGKVKEAVRKRSGKPAERGCPTGAGGSCTARRSPSDALGDCRQSSRPSRRRITPSCDIEDEALHPMHSKALQNFPAQPCNSHDALPAGRRSPSHSKKVRLERQKYSSSHSPMWRDFRQSDSTLTCKCNRCFHRKMVQVLHQAQFFGGCASCRRPAVESCRKPWERSRFRHGSSYHAAKLAAPYQKNPAAWRYLPRTIDKVEEN